MYEKQEEYENKKKESKQAELEFRETEKDLRQKDLEIQESMIQFSVFLQDNEKKKMKAKQKIDDEKALSLIRDKEIEQKRKLLANLEQKAMRIDAKKKAIEKYQIFLDSVQKRYPDDFIEVDAIINRYIVLITEDEKLAATG